MVKHSAPTLHNRIAVLRAERGQSRADLASAIGVNPQTIGYLERGDYNPSLVLAMQLSAHFGLPIDASGAFPDGSEFRTPAEFRKILAAQSDEFIKTLTVKLLTYAMGRGVEYYDMPVVRTIMRQAAASEHKWSALILGIVNSMPFQMNRAGDPTAAATQVAGAR